MADIEQHCIGCKAFYRTKVDGAEFYGYIQGIDAANATITFYNVVKKETGQSLNGLQHVYTHEICDLNITDEMNVKLRHAVLSKDIQRSRKGDRSILKDKMDVPHLKKLQEYVPRLLEMKAQVHQEMEDSLDDEGRYASVLPRNCSLVEKVESEEFKEAITRLKGCQFIGVTFEGINIGREGELCWILMSTREHVTYFDVKTMGKPCFDKGIRDLLQCPDIQKVIHDCRLASDMLHHQYNTKLVNIFDTQVASAFVYRLCHRNDFPRYVPSLSECVHEHLMVDKEDLHFPLVRSHNPELDEVVWGYRPAPSVCYSWMHKHCCFLLSLQDVLLKGMMVEFQMGVNIYLRSLRDASLRDANKQKKIQHLLPSDFLGLSLEAQVAYQMKKRRQPVSRKYMGVPMKDGRGFQENCRGVSHPGLVASHDTIWHTPQLPRTHNSAQQNNSKKASTTSGDSSVDATSGYVSTNSAQPTKPWERAALESKLKTDSGSSSQQLSTPFSDASGASPHSEKDSGVAPQDLTPCVEQAQSTIADSSDSREAATNNLQGCKEQRPSSLISSSSMTSSSSLSLKDKNELLKAFLLEQSSSSDERMDMKYVFRPAGVKVSSIPKKKRIPGEGLIPGDLASGSRAVETPEGSGEFEFDAIPDQKVLFDNYRSKEAESAVFVRHEISPEDVDGEFQMDSFTQVVAPPVYVDPNLRKPDPNLSAIVPRVDDFSQLLCGARPSSFHASQRELASSDEASPVEGGGGDADSPDVSGDSVASAGGNVEQSSDASSFAHLKRNLQEAGRDCPSNTNPKPSPAAKRIPPLARPARFEEEDANTIASGADGSQSRNRSLDASDGAASGALRSTNRNAGSEYLAPASGRKGSNNSSGGDSSDQEFSRPGVARVVKDLSTPPTTRPGSDGESGPLLLAGRGRGLLTAAAPLPEHLSLLLKKCRSPETSDS